MAGLQQPALSPANDWSPHGNSWNWKVENVGLDICGPRREIFSLLDDGYKYWSTYILLRKRVTLFLGGKKKPKQNQVSDFYEREDIFSTINPECRRHFLSAGHWSINVPDRLSLKFPVLANSSLLCTLPSELCSCDRLEAHRDGFRSCYSNQINRSLLGTWGEAKWYLV